MLVFRGDYIPTYEQYHPKLARWGYHKSQNPFSYNFLQWGKRKSMGDDTLTRIETLTQAS